MPRRLFLHGVWSARRSAHLCRDWAFWRGDIVKAAHDIQLPLVGIGILWQEGYTAQYIGDDGKPYDISAFSTAGLEDTGAKVVVQVGRDEVPCGCTTAFRNAPLPTGCRYTRQSA